MLKWKIQYDQSGNFRMVGEHQGSFRDSPPPLAESAWTPYTGIAMIEDEGHTYIAVTDNWIGTLPTFKVMYINPLPTTREDVERLLDENKQERVFVRSPLTAVSD